MALLAPYANEGRDVPQKFVDRYEELVKQEDRIDRKYIHVWRIAELRYGGGDEMIRQYGAQKFFEALGALLKQKRALSMHDILVSLEPDPERRMQFYDIAKGRTAEAEQSDTKSWSITQMTRGHLQQMQEQDAWSRRFSQIPYVGRLFGSRNSTLKPTYLTGHHTFVTEQALVLMQEGGMDFDPAEYARELASCSNDLAQWEQWWVKQEKLLKQDLANKAKTLADDIKKQLEAHRHQVDEEYTKQLHQAESNATFANTSKVGKWGEESANRYRDRHNEILAKKENTFQERTKNLHNIYERLLRFYKANSAAD